MKNEKQASSEYGEYKIVFERLIKDDSDTESLLSPKLVQEMEEIEALRRFSSELKKESAFFYSSTA
ncbi:MAG: hypothetical protein HQK86_09055 [Nitrospinae bacterium]|nr:hypothetical protein [Nitrospinota bacterium]MBF0635197.1 hypothetical protein [Nitrospinota bacterium]